MDKFLNVATFFTFLTVGVLLCGWVVSSPDVFANDTVIQYCSTELIEPLGIDPPEMSIPENSFPSEDHLRLIGRLAEGLRKTKTQKGESVWWECGQHYSVEQVDAMSVYTAYHLVRAVWTAEDKPYSVDLKFKRFVWGLAGTIANESRFDQCAIGKAFRKAGEKRGFITPNRLTLSRDRGEVLEFLYSDYASRMYLRTGIDLGLAQVLSKYKIGRSWEDMLSLVPGVYDDAKEMKYRAKMFGTPRPWLYWRGSKPLKWYEKKVNRWAKKMGAKDHEL